NLLRSHGVALALVDQVWMPTITELTKNLDVLTTDFTYIRWIGDRKGTEKNTKTWDKIIVDCERETRTWVDYVRQFLHHGRTTYAYYNNHWAGYAPGSIRLFTDPWKEFR
ncbi:MAG TPA: DUF72 domain-containing protein, partial [Terriglobales bacterium]|nr:DUF72 domain-containing protein [Terriglobales bacterium]